MEPKVFNRNPYTVQAMEFTGGKSNAEEILQWVGIYNVTGQWVGAGMYGEGSPEMVELVTYNGVMQANVNWWVVLHEDGSFFLMESVEFPNIFTEKE